MSDDKTNLQMGILERRRIEAEILKPVHAEMVARLGRALADEILGAAITKAAEDGARKFAENEPDGTDLKTFQALQPLWTKDDALVIDVLRADEKHFDYNVTRCRYSEMYREMGLGDIAHLLSCNRDGAFCDGYDPRIKMTRTQTINGGASHCDFRYVFEG